MTPLSRWGPPAVSILVLMIFGGVMLLAMFRTIPDTQPMALLLGAVVSMTTTVVGYWCGSSAGSSNKDATIHALAAPLVTPVVPPMVPSPAPSP